MPHINLKIPEHSYFFGFAQTDGTLGKTKNFKNKGRFQIEIGKNDARILDEFKKLFPAVYTGIHSRKRDTNFKRNCTSYSLTICDMQFREELCNLGLPYGRKADIIAPPRFSFCERDYIRGLLDGDGSVGITASGMPFASFTVKSEPLKDYLLEVIEKLIGERKRIRRNKRDNIYNVMINREKAQSFINYFYYPGCLALKRKLKDASFALKWRRPPGMTRIPFKKFWARGEDEYILSHTVEESCKHLKRTANSIGMRLWRFKTNRIKI